MWTYKGEVNFAVQVREVECEVGQIKHVVIKKLRAQPSVVDIFNSLEPTYQDKIRIRQVLKCKDRDMIEVMPTQRNLVDMANLYHLWILPAEYKSPIQYQPSNEFKYYNENYDIAINELEDVKVISVKKRDGQALVWSEKQKIKDTICGYDRIAVEIIPKNVTYMSNICQLVCLPREWKLPFGIFDEERKR